MISGISADADRATPLDDDLFFEVGVANRVGDFVFFERDQFVDIVAHDSKGQPVIQSDSTAERIGQRRQFFDFDRLARLQRGDHCAATRHRNTDDANVGLLQLDRERDARDQAAAGKLDQHRVEIGQLLEHFEPERTLTRDYVRVIERGDHRVAFFVDETFRFDFGFVLRPADDTGFGAERANAVELVLRHQFGHAEDAGHAGRPRRKSQRTAVVAGRYCSDAASTVGELQHGIHRAAQFERAGGLQVFVGEVYIALEALAERRRCGDPERLNMRRDAFARRVDIVQRERGGVAHALP